MAVKFVLLPVFALVALAFGLCAALARMRTRALLSGEVKFKDVALVRNWPERILKIGNSYDSQFEMPVLFYALVALAIVTGRTDAVFVAMEWGFVATRYVHAYIHVTSNNVPRRFYAFASGSALLALMWAIFAARIVLS